MINLVLLTSHTTASVILRDTCVRVDALEDLPSLNHRPSRRCYAPRRHQMAPVARTSRPTRTERRRQVAACLS